MKTIVARFIAICVCFAFVCMNSAAQDETIAAAAGDRYLISAKAGGVNFVAGTVSVVRKEGKSGALLKGDTLQIGDRVSTGPDGKAEILLNPGSFLRLGGDSAFEFKTTSLEDLQLKIQNGSAIFEVFATNDFQVSVSTPKTNYLLIETGVYRVDVLGGGDARLEVWKGAARIPNSAEIVKTGRVANVRGSGGISITKFDRGEKDALDIWSKARGKELARISALLKRGNLRTTLMRSFLGRRWNMFGSFGLWVYDPFFGGYCFLPFGYGWNSPYGYGYGNYIGWYDLPPVIYYPPHTGGGNSGGGTTTPTITPIVSAGDRSPVPPFVRMQETMGGGRGGDRGGDRGGSSYDPGSSSPSYSPPSSSSSSSSSPAPTKSDSPPPPPTKQP